MGFYLDHIVPVLLHAAMRDKRIRPFREKVIPKAQGRVLEVGVGSGLNLPFYGTAVTSVTGLDPSKPLLKRAEDPAGHTAFPVELIEGSAEEMAFENASFDSVVTTWSLCSIPDAAKALREMRRVMKADGQLLFVEHGRAESSSVRAWQNRLNPYWHCVSGGCNVNRDIMALIRGAGLTVEGVTEGHQLAGPKIFTYFYEGIARPK